MVISLYSHVEELRETASLTWLMKRLLRFSLTVKTKDATETLHACMPTPYRFLRTRPLCRGPILHQPHTQLLHYQIQGYVACTMQI